MIPERPKGPRQRVGEAASPSPLPGRNPRDPLTITIRYRGGSEAWWAIEGRGRTWYVPGHLCLHDVLTMVQDGRGGHPRQPKGYGTVGKRLGSTPRRSGKL